MLEAKKEEKRKLAPEDEELIMKLSPIYERKLAQSRQEGVQQGIQQGIQQGTQQEANSLISRQLKRKLGNLPPEYEAKVISLPLATLEDLGEALLDFNSVEDLINWLNQN